MPNTNTMSNAEEIQKLNDLHTQGVLSDDEFQTAKGRLLSGASAAGSPALSNVSEKQWLVILHLSQFAGALVPLAGMIVPILIWQLKKDDLPSVDAHGKVIANWLITSLICAFIFGLLSFVMIGIPLLMILVALAIVFPIVGAIKANNNELWRYPLSFTFF